VHIQDTSKYGGKKEEPLNGFIVTAFDSSRVTIEIAAKSVEQLNVLHKPKLIVQKLQAGLPCTENEYEDSHIAIKNRIDS
jgi:hypothetical protein